MMMTMMKTKMSAPMGIEFKLYYELVASYRSTALEVMHRGENSTKNATV